MSGLYTLRLINESPLAGNMCLYQRHPQQDVQAGLYSIAWLSQPCRPGHTLTFSWSIEYGLAWSKTESIHPGLIFEPSAICPANPEVPGQSLFTLKAAPTGCAIEPTESITASPGRVTLQVDPALGQNQVPVALTVSGKPAFAQLIGPTKPLQFQPPAQYWVAFGPFEAGQILDFSELVLTSELQFAPGKRSAVAAFQRDCSWNIR